MKKIMKLALGAGCAAALADCGLAYYFFSKTMVRSHASAKRTGEMAGTNWDAYISMIRSRKVWLQKQPNQKVSVTARDGLTLKGTFFQNAASRKTVLCFHGYTSNGISDFCGLSAFYLSMGYNLLIVDERAHGESGGTYIGFGCLDRWDALKWVQFLQNRMGDDCEILLHGFSMGAATVLMASGLHLPSCVKGIISDCAFTSAWDVFHLVLNRSYHLPAYPILKVADVLSKKYAGFGLAECNAAREVKKAGVPILFIHGGADSFVPLRMCHELHNACSSRKDLLIVKDAGHVESYYRETDRYERKIKEFFKLEVSS